MAGTTAVKHLRYPTGGDAPSFAVDMKNLADDTDAAITAITPLYAQFRKINPSNLTSALAAIPLATTDGTNTLTGSANPTFTATAAGTYEISACLMFTANAGIIQAAVFVNGAQRYTAESTGTPVLTTLQIPSARVNLSAGDTVDLRAAAAAAGAQIFASNGYENWLLIKKTA